MFADVVCCIKAVFGPPKKKKKATGQGASYQDPQFYLNYEQEGADTERGFVFLFPTSFFAPLMPSLTKLGTPSLLEIHSSPKPPTQRTTSPVAETPKGRLPTPSSNELPPSAGTDVPRSLFVEMESVRTTRSSCARSRGRSYLRRSRVGCLTSGGGSRGLVCRRLERRS